MTQMLDWICRTAGMGFRSIFRRDLDPRLAFWLFGLGLNLVLNLIITRSVFL